MKLVGQYSVVSHGVLVNDGGEMPTAVPVCQLSVSGVNCHPWMMDQVEALTN